MSCEEQVFIIGYTDLYAHKVGMGVFLSSHSYNKMRFLETQNRFLPIGRISFWLHHISNSFGSLWAKVGWESWRVYNLSCSCRWGHNCLYRVVVNLWSQQTLAETALLVWIFDMNKVSVQMDKPWKHHDFSLVLLPQILTGRCNWYFSCVKSHRNY